MSKPAQSARQAALGIIATLRQAGYTAFLAGGCVRDDLLGREPKDYDIATDAEPDKVQALLPKSSAVGAAFGVILVYTNATSDRPRWITEVATFRADSGYTDGRRPDSVRFTDAREDAKRRDFTINGLFAAPPAADDPPGTPDRIIDYVQGQADLQAQVIRAIGDPGDRFGEDYLRMLRAVRFAARLGFAIEPKTAAAIRVHARYLGQISRERIGQELLAMLSGPKPHLALNLLQELKLDAPTLNEDPGSPPLTVSERLDEQADVPTRLAGWLIDRHGLDTPYTRTIDRWRKALSLSNDHRDDLSRLLKLMEQFKGWQGLTIAQRKRMAVLPAWEQGLLLFSAVGGDSQTLRNDVMTLARDGVGLSPAPLLNGEDLIRQGMTPGPAFKTTLDKAYDRQLEGELTNRERALEWLQSVIE